MKAFKNKSEDFKLKISHTKLTVESLSQYATLSFLSSTYIFCILPYYAISFCTKHPHSLMPLWFKFRISLIFLVWKPVQRNNFLYVLVPSLAWIFPNIVSP